MAVGERDGVAVGRAVGIRVGGIFFVGVLVGVRVGRAVGERDGLRVGCAVGMRVGYL